MFNYNIVNKSSFYRLQTPLSTPLPLFDLMGYFHIAKIYAQYLMLHHSAIMIIGKL